MLLTLIVAATTSFTLSGTAHRAAAAIVARPTTPTCQILPPGFVWADDVNDEELAPSPSPSPPPPVPPPQAAPAPPQASTVTAPAAPQATAVPESIESIDDDRLSGLPIAAWGCDQATWTAVKNKKGLIKLLETGQEEHFKTRLARLKVLIAEQPSAAEKARLQRPKAAKAGEAAGEEGAVKSKRKNRSDPEKRRKSRRAKAMLIPGFQETRRSSGAYVLYGTCPDGVDQDAITSLLEERSLKKDAKDYEAADAIREKLNAMHVKVRDDFRTWSYAE